MNENKELLLQKVSTGRKDIMEIKIQYFEIEEQLDKFMSNLERQQRRAQRRPKAEYWSPPRQLRMSLDDFKENYSSVKSQYIKLQKIYMEKDDFLKSLKKNSNEELLKRATVLERKLRPLSSQHRSYQSSNNNTVKSVKIMDTLHEDLQNEIS